MQRLCHERIRSNGASEFIYLPFSILQNCPVLKRCNPTNILLGEIGPVNDSLGINSRWSIVSFKIGEYCIWK